MRRSGSLWTGVIAFLSALVVMLGVVNTAGAAVKDLSEWQSTPTAPEGWYEPASGDAATLRPNAIGTLVKIGDQQMSNGLGSTMGMCIDTLFTSPEESAQTHYGAPTKLETIVTPSPDEVKNSGYKSIPFEGDIRDSAIYVAKLAVKAWQDGSKDDFADYSVALQYLLTSHRLGQYPTGAFGPERARASHDLTAEKFLQITGYKQSKVDPTVDGFTFERDTTVEIPKAGEDEYLTVLVPSNFDSYFEQSQNGRIVLSSGDIPQRVVPIDQPGLNMDTLNPFVPSLSSSIQPKKMEANAGTFVTDTIHFAGLVPNTEYRIESSLVDKADSSHTLGVGELTFTTGDANELNGSVSGTQDVTIEITADSSEIKQVEAAVAFASLYSKEVDSAGNALEKKDSGDEPEGSLIAEHKDIEDQSQTVTLVVRTYNNNGLGEAVPGVKSTPVESSSGHGFGGGGYAEGIAKYGGIYIPSPQPGGVYGLGWCIDFGLMTPNENSTYLYSVPKKLTHILEKDGTDVVALEGDLRDSAIHVLKKAVEAYHNGDGETAKTYSTVLNILIGSYPLGIVDFINASAQGGINGVTLERFRQLSGFSLTGGNGSVPPALVRDTSIVIPKAGEDEYITAMAPVDYVLGSFSPSTFQRIVPIDQPGLKFDSEQVPNEFSPAIEISVSPKEVELSPGLNLTDTVSYKGLVPNTQYTLTSTLVDKTDPSKVLGEGKSTFTTGTVTEPDGSVTGTATTQITVTASQDSLSNVQDAVVFEELTSVDVDRAGNPSSSGEVNVIAEHKDIADSAGTIIARRDDSVLFKESGKTIDPEIQTDADQCYEVTDENYWPQDCNIIHPDPTISMYSAPEERTEAVAELLEVINDKAGQRVIEYLPEPERNYIRVVVHPDYDLGSHGDRFSDIQEALRQYGFTEIEVIN